MAQDLSLLVVEVQSKGIANAAKDLDALTVAATKAEEATKKLGTVTAVQSTSQKKGTDAVLQENAARAVQASALNKAHAEALKLNAALDGTTVATNKATSAIRMNNVALQEAHSLARGLTGSLGALWTTYGNVGGMAIGLALGASLKGVVSVGKDVEHQLEKIRVLGQTSTAEIANMRLEIEKLGQGAFGPREVVEAMSVLTMAGLNAKEAIAGVGAALNLALAGDVSIEKASSTLVQISTALGFTSEAFAHIGDVVAKTAAVSMSSVDSISGAFKSAAAVGEQYGASLNSIGTGLAAVANLGIQGTAAGTALKNFYKDLTSGNEKSTAALKAMGLSLKELKDPQGNLLSLLDIAVKLEGGLRKVEDRSKALGDIFGERGVKVGAAIIALQNAKSEMINSDTDQLYASKLEEINDQIAKSYGFTAMAAIAMGQTSSSQIKSISSTLQTSFLKAFEDLSPKIGDISRGLKAAFSSKEFIDGITSIVKVLGDLAVWLTKNTDAIKILVGGFALFKAVEIAAGFAAVATAATATATAVGTAATATKIFQAALGPLGIALLAAGAAWAYFASKKDAATDVSRINNLVEAVDKLKVVEDELIGKAKKREEIAALRKAGVSEEEIAIKMQSKAVEEATKKEAAALDKVNEAAKKNADEQKARWATQVANMNTIQRYSLVTAEKALKEGRALTTLQSGIIATRDKALAGVAEQEAAYKTYKETQNNVLRLSKEQAKFDEDEARKKNERVKGTNVIGEKGPSQSELMNAELDKLKDAYNERMNDYKMYLDETRDLVNKEELTEREALEKRTIRRAEELESMRKFIKEYSSVYAKYGESVKAGAGVNFIEKDIRSEERAQSKDEQSVTKREIENQKKLAKEIERTGVAEEKRLQKLLDGENLHLAGINELKSVKEAYRKKELEDDLVSIENKIQELRLATLLGVAEGRISLDQAQNNMATIAHAEKALALQKERVKVSGLQIEAYKKEEAENRTTQNLNEAVEAAKRFQKSMTDAFGAIGTAAGGLAVAFAQMNKDEDTALRKKNSASKDAASQAKAEITYSREMEQTRLNGYANMANAAKGFFKEGSAGYKTMDGIAKVAHTAQVARNVIEMGQMAVKAVLNQAAGDPYTAFARMAAMATAVAALGFAVGGGLSGGKGGKSSEEMQKVAGTGSVFGDIGQKGDNGEIVYSIKSESLSKSLEALDKNSSLLLPVNQDMLRALRAIETSMTGLTNLIVRTEGITTGSNMGIQEGKIGGNGMNNFQNTLMGTNALGSGSVGAVLGLALGGPIGAALGAVLGGVFGNVMGKLWGSVSQNIVDSGIRFEGNVADLQAGKGYEQYASVDTTTKSFFGLKKKTTNEIKTEELDKELSQQFGLVFTNIENVLKSAAPALGKSGKEVEEVINNFSLSLTSLPLKGLKGDEITKAINAVLSKASDDIAKKSFPGYEKFAAAGEGYTQTVVRVATNILNTEQIFASLGKTLDLTSPATAGIVDSFVNISGGMDKLTSTTKTFIDGFFTQSEKLDPLQKALDVRMKELGASSVTTSEQFKALVLSQDLTTKTGQETYNALVTIAPAFKAITDAANEFNKKRRDLLVDLSVAQGDTGAKQRAEREDALKELAKISPEFATIKQATYDALDATQRANAARAIEIDMLNAQGQSVQVTAINRATELEALKKVNPELVESKNAYYAMVDANQKATASRTIELETLNAQGESLKVLGINRSTELEALKKVNPELVESKKAYYAIVDAAQKANASRAIEVDTLNALGETSKVTAINREVELEALRKTNPELVESKKAYYGLVDSIKALKDAEEFRTAQRGIEIQIYSTQKEELKVLNLQRQAEIESLRKTQPSLIGMLKSLYAIQDAAKAFSDAMTKVDVAMKQLTGSVNADKEAAKKKFDEDKTALTKRQKAEEEAAKNAFTANKKAISEKEKLELASLESSKFALNSQINALRGETEAQKKAVDVLIKSSEDKIGALKDLLSSIKKSEEAVRTPMSRAMAMSTVSSAKDSKDLTNFEGLKEAIETLAKPAENLFSTFLDYQTDQANANAVLTDLEAAGQVQLTDAQKSLEVLVATKAAIEAKADMLADLWKNTMEIEKEAIKARADAALAAEESRYQAEQDALEARHTAEQDALTSRHEADIQRLDDILIQAQKQVDKLNGIDTSIKSLSEAMRGFGVAIAIASANKDIASSIGIKLPSFDVGTNEIPEDMLAQVHKGERIIPAADNAELMRRLDNEETKKSSNDGELAAKVGELIEVIKTGDIASILKQHEMLKIIREWDQNGMPPARIV